MTRIAFLINPIAGGGRALRGWESFRGRIGGEVSFDSYRSERPGQAVELAERAALRGYDVVVAVGGDGTIHETVNGLMRAGYRNGAYTGPCLGILPLGRGNDFARTFRLQGDIEEVWRRQLAALDGPRHHVDVGRLASDDEPPWYFVNMCGAGFDADVAAMANRLPRRLGGALPYVMGIIFNFVALKSRQLEIELSDVIEVSEYTFGGWDNIIENRDDGGLVNIRVQEQLLLTLTGIGRFLGGGMMLLPFAEPSDGYLDVMLVRPVGRVRLLRVLGSSFRGEHVAEPEVAYFRARRVMIRGPSGTNFHADGDYVRQEAAVVDALPRVLPVLF